MRAIDEDWPGFLVVELRDILIKDAGDAARRHALRAYDAVHLASCLLLRRQLDHDITFACWDAGLAGAAVKAGLRIIPHIRDEGA